MSDCSCKESLLTASQKGHTKCVTRLLRSGGEVLQKDDEGKNCLILAIENHHKDTALAILSGKEGLKFLEIEYKKLTPLQMLIEEMPDLAEFVLNRCVTLNAGHKGEDSIDSDVSIDREDNVGYISINSGSPEEVEYNYTYLKDNTSQQDSGVQVNGTDGAASQGDPESAKPVTLQSSHVLKWMNTYKRSELLHHPLVKQYLFHRFWLKAFPLIVVYFLFHCTFLIFLNSFALLSPRPGPESETCSGAVTGDVNNGTVSQCSGQSGDDRRYLTAAAITLYLYSLLGLGIELVQMILRQCQYWLELDNYFQLSTYLLTIIFVSGFGNDCWCAPSWQWQIGAFSVFLAWFNFIFILKDMPCTAIPIHMFISICITFLKLIYLPILLVLSFAIPFYMVFVRTASSYEGDNPLGGLAAFRAPANAIAKTMFQLAGEIDFETLFNEGDLLYNPTTYILFITFLVVMPLLFANLLIGLAVGDTQEVKKKAELAELKVRVEFILEITRMCSKTEDQNDRYSKKHKWWSSNRCTRFLLKLFGRDYNCHKNLAVQLKERNDDIYKQIMMTSLDELKEEVCGMKQEIASLQKNVEASFQEIMRCLTTK